MNPENNKVIESTPSFEDISSIIINLKKTIRDGGNSGDGLNGDVSKKNELIPIAINPETTKFLIFYSLTSGNPDLITNKNFDLVERIIQSPALSRAFNSDGKYVQFYDKNANTTDEDQYAQMMNGMYIFFLRYYTFLYENRLHESDMSTAEKKLKKYLIDVSRLSTNEKLLGKEVIVRDVSKTLMGVGIAFSIVATAFCSQFILQHLSNYLGHKANITIGSWSGEFVRPIASLVGTSGVVWVFAKMGMGLGVAAGLVVPATVVGLLGAGSYGLYTNFLS